jgi:hypothetical protein
LIYRARTHLARKGQRRSFSERDYADLLDAAHARECPVIGVTGGGLVASGGQAAVEGDLEGVQAAFHRVIQRLRPLPVRSRLMIAR